MIRQYKTNQSGFGFILILLFILVLALVALAGVYVFNKHQNLPAKVSLPPVTTTKTSTVNATPASNRKYLTIKEWGVRAPYTGSDTLTYKLIDNGKTAQIISKNLEDNYGCNDNGTTSMLYGAGAISQVSPTDQAQGPYAITVAQDVKNNPTNYSKEIGGYYYIFAHDQAACSDATTVGATNDSQTAGEKAQTTAEDSTKALLPLLQAIPAQ